MSFDLISRHQAKRAFRMPWKVMLFRGQTALAVGGYIGGTSPSLPTATPAAASDPSGLTLALTRTCAPGTIMSRLPGSNVTIGASGGTTIVFSPSLYLSMIRRAPSTICTCEIVVFVIMLPGLRSHG